MGANITKQLTNTNITNQTELDLFTSIKNSMDVINKSVSNSILDVSVDITNTSNSSSNVSQAVVITVKDTQKFSAGDINQDMNVKINFEAVSKAISNGDFANKMQTDMSKKFGQSGSGTNDLTASLKSVLDQLNQQTKDEPLLSILPDIGLKQTTQETNTNVVNSIKKKLDTFISNSNKIQDIVEKNFKTNLKNNINNKCLSISDIKQSVKIDVKNTTEATFEDINQKLVIEKMSNCINNSNFGAKILEDMATSNIADISQKGESKNKAKADLDSTIKLTNTQKIGIGIAGGVLFLFLFIGIIYVYNRKKKNRKSNHQYQKYSRNSRQYAQDPRQYIQDPRQYTQDPRYTQDPVQYSQDPRYTQDPGYTSEFSENSENLTMYGGNNKKKIIPIYFIILFFINLIIRKIKKIFI